MQEISEQLNQIRHRTQQLEKECQMLEREQEKELAHWQVVTTLEQFQKQLETSLTEMTVDQKKAIIQLLVEEVMVDVETQQIIVKHTIPLNPRSLSLSSWRSR